MPGRWVISENPQPVKAVQGTVCHQDFMDFYQEHEIILKNVEDAYLLARYFPGEYSQTEVQKMIEVLETFTERFRKWRS